MRSASVDVVVALSAGLVITAVVEHADDFVPLVAALAARYEEHERRRLLAQLAADMRERCAVIAKVETWYFG